MFPVFHVRQGAMEQSAGVVGAVTRTTHGRETWVGDGWIGFLKGGGATLIAGRWRQEADFWVFTPEDPDNVAAIRARPEWDVLDGYWGERAEIVLDQTHQWHRTRFQPADAVRVQGPAGVWFRRKIDGDTGAGEVIKDGWDHEHCAICGETLGLGGQPEAYVSGQRIWVCGGCYTHFVEHGSLDFIPSV
jgi:hypothetical protein